MLSKTNNIAEYILYLWQIEDFLRAFPNQADQNYELKEISLMMHQEGIVEKGHLQLAQIALQEVEEIHSQLLDSEATYRAAMMQISPQLAILKSKSDNPTQSDISMIFVFLYNFMLLRLQKKEISAETLLLQQQISKILAHLSKTYKESKE